MVKIFLMMAMLLAFSACGDDSSSSAEPTDSELDSSSGKRSGSSSSYTPKSATTVVDAQAKDMRLSDKPEDGTVTDSANGTTYKTRTVGIFTWTTENINVKNTKIKSTCYAYDDSNCDPYGRLYMVQNAVKACPAGYTIPTVSDWKFMRQQDPNAFTFAGTCAKNDTLECSGIDESVQYLAYDDSTVVMDTSGSFSARRIRENEFYSLRCIKYRTILENEEDLPECKKNRFYNYPSIYVANSNADFTCSDGEWVSSRATGPCGIAEEGERYKINELVFICSEGHWRWSTPKEAGVECTKKNIHEEFVVNSIRYACTDSGLVKLTFPSSELGLCYSKRKGQVGNTDSLSYYICDGEAWKNATVGDVLGKCDSTNKGKSGMFKGMSYTCQSSTWNLTTINDILGDCTAKRQGEIKEYEDGFVTCHGKNWVTSKQIELDFGECTEKMQDSIRQDDKGFFFGCNNGYWEEKNSDEILGDCQADNEGSTGKYGPNTYICTGGAWDPLDALDATLGNCTEQNFTNKIEHNGVTYFCKYSNQYEWSAATQEDELLGYCPMNGSFTKELGGILYKCDNSRWREAVLSDVLTRCMSDEGKSVVFKGQEYICDTTAYNNNWEWYVMTSTDSLLGEYCRSAILKKAVMYNNTVYVCTKGANKKQNYWATGTIMDYLGKCTEKRLGERGFNGIDTCVCVHNVCDDNRKTDYTYNGKDTNVCVNPSNGYNWVPIIHETIVDKRDSEVYGVLTFGTQKWLNRELHYTIETAYSSEGYLLGHYPKEFLHTYLYYYTWDDAFGNGSDICPDGTHIPSEAEWTTLFDYVSANLATEGYDMLFAIERNYSALTNVYGFSLKRRGFVDIDYYGPREGAPTNMTNPLNSNLAGNEDITNMFYWITGAGNSSSTGNVVHADSNGHISYESNALKEDAYMIRCILD